MSKPTTTAAAGSSQGMPNWEPKMPAAAPRLTSASDRLSLAAAISAWLRMRAASRRL